MSVKLLGTNIKTKCILMEYKQKYQKCIKDAGK